MRRLLPALFALWAVAAAGQETVYTDLPRDDPGFQVETRIKAAPQGDYPAFLTAARLEVPTTVYDHDVLGGLPRWSVLSVTARSCARCPPGFGAVSKKLAPNLVFEDTAPRLWDVTGNGLPEVVVVQSHTQMGARLTVWRYGDGLKMIAATPFIGQPQRWLAPAGIGDFDGDGRTEIAYVDRPHLKRDLVFVRYQGGALAEIARIPGLTNHRLGSDVIVGGTRNCGAGDEVVLADADWKQAVAVRLDGAKPQMRKLGRLLGPGDLARFVGC
jgi:hypothetical protein